MTLSILEVISKHQMQVGKEQTTQVPFTLESRSRARTDVAKDVLRLFLRD